MLTINNTLEGYLKDIEIKGNTWQNAENLADIRSVGGKVEGQELYEIDVVSCGKNLFVTNDIAYDTYYGIDASIQNNKIVLSGTCNRGTNLWTQLKLTTSIKLYKGKEYVFTHSYSQGSGYLFLRSSLNSTIRMSDNTPITLSEDVELDTVQIQYVDSATYNESIKIQIEEGTQATPYEPYQEDKLTILSPTPLEKVGDVADRIVCKDGVWGVEKNVETKFNYNEQWLKVDTSSSTHSIYYKNEPNVKTLSHVISNVIPTYKYGALYSDCNEFAIGTHNNSNTIRVCIEKSKLLSDDKQGFMNWLKSNGGLIVKYATTQPTFIPLPNDQQIALRTFADRTHIHFETEIEPTIKAQVPKSLGATVNTHTTQIDNLNKELDRVKKLEESTVSTVTSSKAFTTIAETTGGYFEDVKIEGKTLVNLLSPNYHSVSSAWGTDEKKFILDIVTGSGQPMILGKFIQGLKRDTKYTAIVNMSSYTHGIPHFCFMNKENNKTTTQELTLTSSGLHKLVFTTKPDMDSYYFRIIPRNGIDNKYSIDRNIIILEGDHTQNPPSYFEGLKSVGQDIDEIEILSRSKNLLDESFYKVNSYYTSDNTSANESTKSYAYSKVIKLKPKTEYTLTHLGGIEVPPNKYYRFGITDYNKKEENVYCMPFSLNNTSSTDVAISTKTSNTFTTNESGLVCIRCYNNSSLKELLDNSMNKFVLLEGTETSNVYLKSELNKKEILYYSPNTQTWEKPVLREWDSIEKHSDGKYYYHKRSEEVVFNGSENWVHRTSTINPQVNTLHIDTNFAYYGGSWDKNNSICDKFNSIDCWVKDEEGMQLINSNKIRINISKTKAIDVQAFKTWLQANNVTVVYQLAKEEVYECTNLDLITYQNETNLIVSSGAIQPKITLKVLSNISNVVKLLQEKVSLLENNINEYMISQNRSQLYTTYKSDSITFKVDYVNSSKNMTNDYSEDLYNLILDNILVGKDNYNYDHMFNLIMDYASWNKITWEQFDILLELIELQNNPVEELPEELN